MAASNRLDVIPVLFLVLLQLQSGAFLLVSEVPCPNPAVHCKQELFNNVIENQGCLGCQTGCQPGYIMTANPRYFVDTDDPSSHYLYQNIPIANNVNVSEPQWQCAKGDSCHSGYFMVVMAGMPTCSGCGDGCAKCTSFNNCQRCFTGFTLNPHTLPGGLHTVTCTHSNVACPSPPANCLHDTYVAAGIGCAGCQLCADGYVITFNPNYLNSSVDQHGTYTYEGLKIRQDINIDEPRFICERGDTCQEGWFGTYVDGTLFCAQCSHGCQSCSGRTWCDVCEDGYNLTHDSVRNTTTCAKD